MECICNEMRKSTRAVSNMYDRMLAPTGLRVTQFSVLRLLSRERYLSIGELADKLELDQTSTTRSIATLEMSGLVERVAHDDPRVKLLRLTSKGKNAVKEAQAYWQRAQESILKSVSQDDWQATLRTLNALASASAAVENRST